MEVGWVLPGLPTQDTLRLYVSVSFIADMTVQVFILLSICSYRYSIGLYAPSC